MSVECQFETKTVQKMNFVVSKVDSSNFLQVDVTTV